MKQLLHKTQITIKLLNDQEVVYDMRSFLHSGFQRLDSNCVFEFPHML